MPYRLSKKGASVLHKKRGRWVVKKRFNSRSKARKMVQAANINMRRQKRKGRK